MAGISLAFLAGLWPVEFGGEIHRCLLACLQESRRSLVVVVVVALILFALSTVFLGHSRCD